MSSSKKRSLPSWITVRDDENGGNNSDVSPNKLEFSKLLEGVVFALSGFVNPERGILRSQALEMGAEYKQDWNSECTLLVCAFHNTPKFRQVEADGGTIVAKEWIKECYTQKKLVDIETYLMHVGKPWRKNNLTHTGNLACETSQPSKPRRQGVKVPELQPDVSSSQKESRGNTSEFHRDKFSVSKVKKWAVDDLLKTLTWLESQKEKPEPGEIRNVAAEGILTCLQDAINLLDNEQGLQQLTEQWDMVPHVVKELIEIEGSETSTISKNDLRQQAVACKKIYEEELKGACVNEMSREPNSKGRNTDKGKHRSSIDRASNSLNYDSDETIEMSEDEINDAYNSLACKLRETKG
ncbi:DNA-repair protein XRCC1 isoform X1 [Amaranthus tricolor]|uniref:DNA-repair protein XRCC1 isoform X1 n=1 Tax=Amaranthus tricolor TaxID=29722 RepID=UPI0025835E52|nr:DNA-repair protein XRCC1 isoform X1 [Amaranthus tricolor]XP_057525929.1 DNA-repair protein XRCC1 isoform X1 [Amaranthus tricolor]